MLGIKATNASILYQGTVDLPTRRSASILLLLLVFDTQSKSVKGIRI